MAIPATPAAPILTTAGDAIAFDIAFVAGATDYDTQIATNSGFTTGVQIKPNRQYGAAGFVGLTPNTPYWVRLRAHNASGYSAYGAASTITTAVRGRLDIVESAAVAVSGGAIVSLRSDAADPAAITIGYSALADGVTWTTIATIPTAALGGASSSFRNPSQLDELALVADAAGNLYVIGRAADIANKLLIRQYSRVGTTNVWAAGGVATQNVSLSGNVNTLIAVAASFVAGSGVTPVDTIVAFLKYDCPPGAENGTSSTGWHQFAVLSVPAIAASGASPILSINSTTFTPYDVYYAVLHARSDLAVLPGTTTFVGVSWLGSGGASFVVGTDVNGAITVVKAPTALNGPVDFLAKWRIIGIDANTFALIYPSAGALKVAFFSATGAALGTATYAAANSQGGAFTDRWDAYYNPAVGALRIYYIADDSAIKLESIDVSPSTYLVTTATVLSTAFGAAGSTNRVRVPRANNDGRHVLVEGANLAAGVQTLVTYSDTSGNLVPNAPTLGSRPDFDAGSAVAFPWIFSDPNIGDGQASYQLQIQRVSDSVNVVDTGQVTSTTSSYTSTAGALVNGVSYRWRVRVWDGLGGVSAYSAYSTFAANSAGTLTITDPVADDPAGIITSSYPVVWTYAQSSGYTQTQRRVRVLDATTSAVYSDTTMQASTTLGYTVTGLPSGVRVKIEVTLINSNGGTSPVATRYLTSTWASPSTPTFVGSVNVASTAIAATNPAPAGNQPVPDHNLLLRRLSGTTDPYVAVASFPVNGTVNDHGVKSGVSYDYAVSAVSTAGYTSTSAAAAIVAPLLTGAWIFDTASPDATEANFPFFSSRPVVNFDVEATKVSLTGRRLSVIEYGEHDSYDITLAVMIPFSADNNVTHDAQRKYWFDRIKARSTICYRDNRGRLIYGGLADAMGGSDTADGTIVAVKISEVDYTIAVA